MRKHILEYTQLVIEQQKWQTCLSSFRPLHAFTPAARHRYDKPDAVGTWRHWALTRGYDNNMLCSNVNTFRQNSKFVHNSGRATHIRILLHN